METLQEIEQAVRDETKLLHDKACLYYMNFYEQLWAICKKAVHDDERAHELMSDVVLERLPRIIELWDETKPLRHYVNTTIRWYVLKHLARERVLQHRYNGAIDPNEKDISFQDIVEHNESVEHMLAPLNEYEKSIVLLYIVHGYSYSDIGEFAGISRVKVSKIVNESITKIRTALSSN